MVQTDACPTARDAGAQATVVEELPFEAAAVRSPELPACTPVPPYSAATVCGPDPRASGVYVTLHDFSAAASPESVHEYADPKVPDESVVNATSPPGADCAPSAPSDTVAVHVATTPTLNASHDTDVLVGRAVTARFASPALPV
jgi:hypothetical protein